MNNNRKLKIKKLVKKGATISLCAVLAGGIGVGAYEGINYFSGAQSVQAATDSSEKLTLMKSEKKADEETEDTGDTKASDTKGSLDVSDVAEEAMPSVVAITTKSVQEVQNYYSMFGSQYAPSQEQEVEGSGSGIIIGKTKSELLIATNYHVVDGADTLSVAFADGSAYEATVKGFDENEDLAVVSVATKDISDDTMDAISVAKIGSSDDLKIGEQVVAIGNALGEGQSVTTGIISAKDRSITVNNVTFTGLLMTDAAINSGNSGGALLNSEGKVIAINFAKTSSDGVEGMAYSIPVSNVKDIIDSLMTKQTRNKVSSDKAEYLGIAAVDITSNYASYYGYPVGILIRTVADDSAADKAGLETYDIIVGFDDQTVTTMSGLTNMLQYYEAGEKVTIDYYHMEGSEYVLKSTEVTLGSKKAS